MPFIKKITSKDIQLSKNTINELIQTCNIEQFEELCQKADFIFPFLKERIANDFVKLIKEENLKTIFEFSKIHCADFEDLIVNSWLKFASQDLTDELLELFENGTEEQKTYIAKYFSHIQDPLALEYLNKESYSSFEPLKINCAQTLSKFKDKEVLNNMKALIKTNADDFEKLSAFEFISAYQGEEQINFICQNAFSSAFLTNIISNLLDFNELSSLQKTLDNETLTKIFITIINAYPEDITLDTIGFYQIKDFINLIYANKNQFAINSLLMAKAKFSEFNENDIYSFDLDKNLKEELKNISKLLNSLNLPFDNLKEELENYSNKESFDCALDVILEYKLKDYSSNLAEIFNKKELNLIFYPKIAQILKEFNSINLLDLNIIEKIEDENIKALIKSYL